VVVEHPNEGVRPWREVLGSQIRDARKKAHLTQEDLGNAVGKSSNMIGRYEAGSDAPSVDVLGTIALKLAMHEVNINGFCFSISPRSDGVSTQAEQLQLEFDKEHVYAGATIRITPRKATITITAIAPLRVVSG
jgi:transcriptional regulator with XRE-family HTH domain